MYDIDQTYCEEVGKQIASRLSDSVGKSTFIDGLRDWSPIMLEYFSMIEYYVVAEVSKMEGELARQEQETCLECAMGGGKHYVVCSSYPQITI